MNDDLWFAEATQQPGGTDLEVALHLAKVSAGVAVGRFKSSQWWSKVDGSPVSEADMAVDAAVRSELDRLRGNDGVLTEESDLAPQVQDRVWIIDPIDGTYEFVAGHRDWGTNVALQVDGEIVLGVVTRPLLGEIWWAERGRGAYRQDAAGTTGLQVSTRDDAARCTVTGWPDDDPTGVLDRLRTRFTWTPVGMDALPRLLLGEIDAVVGLKAAPWDFAPAVVLVEEAGGTFMDLAGTRSIYDGAAVFTNGRIDAQIRAGITLDAGDE